MARLTSKQIQEEFGLTRKQFRSQYEVFRRRVQQFNRQTGFNYSPLKEFRYSKLYPKNATIQAILGTASSPGRAVSGKSLQNIQEYTIGRYRGLINVSIELQRSVELLQTGRISLSEFVRQANEVGDVLREKRDKASALAGSEEILTGTYMSDNLVQENQEIVADILF